MGLGTDELLAAYDAEVRAAVPRRPAVGAVVVQEGPVVRTHFGSHGTVEHRDMLDVDVAEVVARQQAAFAERGEPAEWRVYAHDRTPGLVEALVAAGFRSGESRAVLVVEVEDLPVQGALGNGQKLRQMDPREHRCAEQVWKRVSEAGPFGRDLAELEADGRLQYWEYEVLMVEHDARVVDVAWIENLPDARFALIGGFTGRPDVLIPALAGWERLFGLPPWEGWRQRRGDGCLLIEVDDEQWKVLLGLGFREITQVVTFRWAPEGAVVTSRPVRLLFDDFDHHVVWDRFTLALGFSPSARAFPGIAEPVGSATWDLAAVAGVEGEGGRERLEAIVERGLRSSVRGDEPLYWLDWNHAGCRFDPQRVGGPGQPPWPGSAYPDGDYYIHTTSDVRLGTFGHPFEQSLCVFGVELLAQVEEELTALLGRVLRRDGLNQGNTLTLGSAG